MKNFRIALAVGAIVTFVVGTATAVQPIPKPEQEQFFSMQSSVQGVGSFEIRNNIVDTEIAINVRERIKGDTGSDGIIAMESREILNGSVNITDQNDPDYYHYMSIDFSGDMLRGSAKYASSAFYGGMGASAEENYDVTGMEKQETTTIKTTSAVGQKQSLHYNTMTVFNGTWGTTAEWKKPCKKDIKHTETYEGEFAVTKYLIFEELVVPP
ncbi:MAG: hypothetical protein N2V75_07755 [Methanophagales archaeon]|nr:hypothetical protein [Methanophagales archaeon]